MQQFISMQQAMMTRAPLIPRRQALKNLAAGAALSWPARALFAQSPSPGGTKVRTVLGDVSAEALGATLMHEHAVLIDWSELFNNPAADYSQLKDQMLADAAKCLHTFQDCLGKDRGPGAIVECTPIRVGRYPQLLVELAKMTSVHVIACTGFWGEAMAPAHPWAVQLASDADGPRKIAEVYIREIEKGMEDPSAGFGENYTDIKAGIIKVACSTHIRPIERRCHQAAAIASVTTGCPITTHTTDGGGLDQARLFLQFGAKPEKIIIGHQGYMDDRKSESSDEFHVQIAELGCFVQFDRVGHAKYPIEKIAEQIKHLIDAGHLGQILVGHDLVPYVYSKFNETGFSADAWTSSTVDLTTVPVRLTAACNAAGISDDAIRRILIDNPARALAF